MTELKRLPLTKYWESWHGENVYLCSEVDALLAEMREDFGRRLRETSTNRELELRNQLAERDRREGELTDRLRVLGEALDERIAEQLAIDAELRRLRTLDPDPGLPGHLRLGRLMQRCADAESELAKLRARVEELEEERRHVSVVDHHDALSGDRYRTLLAAAVESTGVDAQSVEILSEDDEDGNHRVRFICTAKTKVDEVLLAREVGAVVHAAMEAQEAELATLRQQLREASRELGKLIARARNADGHQGMILLRMAIGDAEATLAALPTLPKEVDR
jgi:hypothetical protein